MDQPLISVIVPVYKAEAYLDRCVGSIVDQTYGNLEILLVDDGSPDQSGAICDAWAAKDSRIRVIHQENAGGGAARNRALDQAKGELIGFVDSDDYLAPEMYQQLYGLICQGAQIAECAITQVEGDAFPEETGTGTVTTVDREQAMGLHIQDTIFRQTPPNKLYCRKTIGDIRFPEGNLIDDEFFTYRVIGNAQRLSHLDRPFYAYRQTPGSAMHKPYSLKRLEGLNAKVQRLAYLEEHLPRLVTAAREDLLLSCVYAMQGSLRYLPPEDLAQARKILAGVKAQTSDPELGTGLGLKKKALLRSAQNSLERTAKLLNFLEDIHLLS